MVEWIGRQGEKKVEEVRGTTEVSAGLTGWIVVSLSLLRNLIEDMTGDMLVLKCPGGCVYEDIY